MLKTLRMVITVAGALASTLDAGAEDKDKPPPQVPLVSNVGVEAHDTDPAVPRNTLRWRTNGLNNYGYDVFRSEAESGPFEKINTALLPGNGQRDSTSQRFEYADTNIDPHKTYWYYVESIDLMGKRAKFTPTIKANPKAPAEPAASASPEPH